MATLKNKNKNKNVSPHGMNIKRIFLSKQRHWSVRASDARTNYCVKSTENTTLISFAP